MHKTRIMKPPHQAGETDQQPSPPRQVRFGGSRRQMGGEPLFERLTGDFTRNDETPPFPGTGHLLSESHGLHSGYAAGRQPSGIGPLDAGGTQAGAPFPPSL